MRQYAATLLENVNVSDREVGVVRIAELSSEVRSNAWQNREKICACKLRRRSLKV
jgi:hypothetical protein